MHKIFITLKKEIFVIEIMAVGAVLATPRQHCDFTALMGDPT